MAFDLQTKSVRWAQHLDLTTAETTLKAQAYAPPTLADLDGDGKLEVIIGTSMGFVYVLDHTARRREGAGAGRVCRRRAALPRGREGAWLGEARGASAGRFMRIGRLHLCDHLYTSKPHQTPTQRRRRTKQGEPRPGWPVQMGPIHGQPLVADLTNDGRLEVFAGALRGGEGGRGLERVVGGHWRASRRRSFV